MTDNDGQLEPMAPAPVPGEAIGRVFCQRFNELLEARKQNGRPVTQVVISKWMGEHGYDASQAYLSQLRSGKSRYPSLKVIEGLSLFFDIDSSYFLQTDDAASQKAILDAIIRDPRLTDIALRASRLSVETIDAIQRIVDQLDEVDNHRTPIEGTVHDESTPHDPS